MGIPVSIPGITVKAKRYEEKQAEGKTSEKQMFGLAWDVEELGRINESGRQLVVESRAMTDKLRDPVYDKVSDNFPRKLSSFREQAVQFLKKSMKFKRNPATHVLVVMISPEERNKKPYMLCRFSVWHIIL